MAKVGQVYHIGHDPALDDTETGRKAECRALNITEELGQVSTTIYINEFPRGEYFAINIVKILSKKVKKKTCLNTFKINISYF